MARHFGDLDVPRYLAAFVYIKTVDYGRLTAIKVSSVGGTRGSEMEFDLNNGMTLAQMWVRVYAEHIRLNQEEATVLALLR